MSHQRLSEIFSKEGSLRKFLKEIDQGYEDTMMSIFTKFNNFQGVPVPSMGKSENRSNQIRQAGNDAYYNNCFGDALSLYNIALMQAPNNTHALARAYNNRSTLLFHLYKIDECIKDIEICLKLPELGDLKEKLQERRRGCNNPKRISKARLQEKSVYKDMKYIPDSAYEKFFNLSGEAHEDIPCASSAVEIVGDKVFASKDIKAGEVISVETAYVSCLKNTEMAICCHYCHRFSFNLIPCQYCCFTLFCNEECRRDSWEEFHKIECEIYKMGVVNNCDFRLSVQAVMKALVSYSSDWNKLMMTVQEAEKSTGYIRGPYNSTSYRNLCTQSNYDRLPRRGKLFECAMNAALIVHTISRIPSLLPFNKKEKKRVMAFLGKQLMFHHEDNAHFGISGSVIQYDKPVFTTLSTLTEKAIGLFPFTRLFRHSCHPNAESFGLFKKKAVVAIRNITKGTEITISYWRHFINKSTIERKRFLYINFGFICKCDACQHLWELRDTDIPKEDLTYSRNRIISMVGCIQDYKSDFKDKIVINGCIHPKYDFIKEALREFSDYPNSAYYKLFLELLQSCYVVFQSNLGKQFGVGVVDPNNFNQDNRFAIGQ